MKRIWWKEAVGYELYPKSFKDTNGDGIGDLKGITEKLPYLKSLGIDFVWICPFYKSPMHDNGYDVADYYTVDRRFGTMEDMDCLLETAKKLDIRIIIDMVLNHTSDQHAWFQEALRNPESKYRNYYIFRKSIDMPSNIRSCFGGSVWEECEPGVWYYHTFDKTQPDLNWENPELRSEIYDMLNYWLDKGISGFRMDAITYIKKAASLKKIESNEEDGLYDIANIGTNQPGIGEFLLEMREKCIDGRDVMTVAEAPGVPYEELGSFIGEKGYFSMIFDFSYADMDLAAGGNWYDQAEWKFGDLKKLLFRSQISVQKEGWGAVYLENHDQPRSLNKYFREKTARPDQKELRFLQGTALATLLMSLRGTVFLYQGEELGMQNCPFDSIEEFDDLNTLDQYHRAVRAGFSEKEAMQIACNRSRDNSRTPYPWNNGKNGGFTEAERPWLKINPDYGINNAEDQIKEKDSLLCYYQKLIAFRKAEEFRDILIYGEILEFPVEAEAVIAFKRIGENGEAVEVYINMDDKVAAIQTEQQHLVIGNYKDMNYNKETRSLTLRPYEAVIIR